MAVTPEALLRAAEVIRDGDDELAWRNAASRAYYAAYHRCLGVVGNMDGQAGGGGVHRLLIDVLTAPRRPNAMRGLGVMLDNCRKYRVAADYDIDTDFDRESAQTTLSMCRDILRRADALD